MNIIKTKYTYKPKVGDKYDCNTFTVWENIGEVDQKSNPIDDINWLINSLKEKDSQTTDQEARE